MATKHALETKLNDILTQDAPALPESAKNTLVAWMPLAAIVAGVLSLVTGWILFNWASAGNTLVGACNEYTVAGCGNWQASRFSLWLLLSVIVVCIQGLMFLAAYPSLRLRRRLGWALMYRATLVNILYGFLSILSSFEATGRFMAALAGSAIALYCLFQIRTFYVAKNPVAVPAGKDDGRRGNV